MSLLDLSGVVQLLATSSFTVKRPDATVYASNGVAADQTFTELTVRGSFQPISGADLKRMPEGSRASEYATIWCVPDELRTRDRVTVPNRGDYEVDQIQPWAESGNYCKVVVKKLNSGEPRP